MLRLAGPMIDGQAPPAEPLEDDGRALERHPRLMAHPPIALRRVIDVRKVGDRLFVELRTTFHFSRSGAVAQKAIELEEARQAIYSSRPAEPVPRLWWIEATANPVRTLAGLTMTNDRSSIEIHAHGCQCSRCSSSRKRKRRSGK